MKNVILFFLLCSFATLQAQSNGNFFQLHFGETDAQPTQLSVDVYPFLFAAGGVGGSVTVEHDHWQLGLTGFGVAPPEFILETFFDLPESVTLPHNSAVELVLNYYPNRARRGIYFGVLGGPEWFTLRDAATGAEEIIMKFYVVPRTGLRLFPFGDTFFVDTSIGYSFNLSGTDVRTLGESSYRTTNGGIIYFMQVGARFSLECSGKK